MTGVFRIGNASGFYGDRLSAFEEMLDAGVDVITGDYLAELTMLILARQKQQDETQGYAKTFLAQLRGSLQRVADTGTRVVVNAGGMNPAGLATAIRELARAAELHLDVAHVEGDDITERSAEFGFGEPLAANAYLGGWGITAALQRGAQIVVTGRVTDAAVITGAAAWHHGWGRTDYDQLAGAMAAGHVIECGMQATGGNFAFFTEISDMARPGFPIAEIAADGSSVITKQPGTGGAVTAETVLSQLLYEIQSTRYAGPDATLRLDTIEVTDLGNDRVRLSGMRGEAPPPELKVSVTEVGGFRQEIVFLLTGLNVNAKAQLIEAQFEQALELSGCVRPTEMSWSLSRTDHRDAATQEEATARLTLLARDRNPKVVGRTFSNLAIEIALGSVPGLFFASPPGDGTVYGRFRPMYVPQDAVTHRVHLANGETLVIYPPAETLALAPTNRDLSSEPGEAPTSHTSEDSTAAGGAQEDPAPAGHVRVPLGALFGARSGDKGGNANIGVWARSEAGWHWLQHELTADRLRKLLPEAAARRIDRTELPNFRALNFVVHGLLGEGVAHGARFDAQAKGVGEWLRSRYVDLPEHLAATAETKLASGEQPIALDDFFSPASSAE